MSLPGMPSSVRCAACGFENTTTSLYCQDCGARLVAPPSLGADDPEPPPAGALPEPPRTKARILSVERPSRGGGFLTVTVRTLVLAALAALIFLALQTPDGIPPAASPLPPVVVENVRLSLGRSQQSGKPFEAPWAGQGLNAYLAGRVLPVKSSGTFGVELLGARLAPAGDGFTLFVERKVAGVPFHTTLDYSLVPRGNGLALARTGATLGRLPLPAWARPAVDSLNADLAHTLDPELAILREAKSVRISPKKAYVSFGAPRP